jgi:hypothetical protein
MNLEWRRFIQNFILPQKCCSYIILYMRFGYCHNCVRILHVFIDFLFLQMKIGTFTDL